MLRTSHERTGGVLSRPSQDHTRTGTDIHTYTVHGIRDDVSRRRDWKDTVNIKAEHSMQMKQRQKDIVLSIKSNVRNRKDDRGQRRDAVRQQSNKSYKLTVVSDNKSAPYKGRRPSNVTFRNNAKNDIIRKKK